MASIRRWIPRDKLKSLEQREAHRKRISSKAWNTLKEQILERDGHRCVQCLNKENLQVHHLTYKRVGKEVLKDLVTLCKRCHDEVHRLSKSQDFTKNTLEEDTNKIIASLIKKFQIPINLLEAKTRCLEAYSRTYIGKSPERVEQIMYQDLLRIDQGNFRNKFLNMVKK